MQERDKMEELTKQLEDCLEKAKELEETYLEPTRLSIYKLAGLKEVAQTFNRDELIDLAVTVLCDRLKEPLGTEDMIQIIKLLCEITK